jgi:stage II sporulation protein AA (anti-sigma F factor antagonist)
MEINEQRQGAVTIVRPKGALVLDDAEMFKTRMGEVMNRSLGRFVIDMAEVPYVDSRGLEVLKETTDELADSGRSLRLCATNETVREVLDLTGLSESFEHFADPTSAARSFL